MQASGPHSRWGGNNPRSKGPEDLGPTLSTRKTQTRLESTWCARHRTLHFTSGTFQLYVVGPALGVPSTQHTVSRMRR